MSVDSDDLIAEYKLCAQCGEVKLLSDFVKDKSQCKCCKAQYDKDRNYRKMISGIQESDSEVESYLYVMYSPMFPDWVKIGKAKNPHARLRELAVGCPHLILFRKFPGEASIEKLMHRLLDNLRNKVSPTDHECGGTEWFKMTPTEACVFIETVICTRNAGLEHVWMLMPKIYA